MTTKLILVGGFLGAGKTTHLLRAARTLAARGRRVGIVTNDQGDDLVDTALANFHAIPVTEVAGGCFCCRFPDLIVALRRLQKEVAPDVILAEPVGSCTDIVATVVRPLHRYYGEVFDVAPFTVLLDPERRAEEMPATMRYLYQKQMDDAEMIALNKLDLLEATEAEAEMARLQVSYPDATLWKLSARTGEGVAPWLEAVLNATSAAARSLEIDYDRYAEAEAALGWLNARGTLRADAPFSATAWMQSLLQRLDADFAEQAAPIAHVKTHLITASATLKASLTQAGTPPSWDTDAPAVQTDRAQFILNVRVNASPRVLERTVRNALETVIPAAGFRHDVTHFECFSPLPPQPTHRL